MDKVTELRQAGFSEEQISQWVSEKRAALSAAGFPDNQIDAWFANGVIVPEEQPPAFQARLEAGAQASKREGGLLQTIPQGIELMSTAEGRGRLWNSVKGFPKRFLEGTLETLKLPGDVMSGKIDLSTEEGLERALGLGELIAGGRPSKLTLTGRTSGVRAVPWGERPYVWDAETGKATRPPSGVGDYDPATTINTTERDPTGAVHEVPVTDEKLNTQHFNEAADAINGQPTHNLDVQTKLRKLYVELGKLPAEVAHEAERDPVTRQQILSKDLNVVPGTREPGPPVEPDQPAGFTTAKGSTYEIHGDGTTTRNKAPRPDPGHEGDFGIKPRSDKTYYLTEKDIQRLAPPQGVTWRIVDAGKGRVSLAIQDPYTGKWGIAPSQRGVPVKTEPAVGLAPLELWNKETVNKLPAYREMHPGNPIKQIRKAVREDAPPQNTIRLYRGETGLPGEAKPIPDYIAESPEFKATQEATGRWFTKDRATAEYYNQQFGDKSGRLSYVDVPITEADRYLSANQPPEVRSFSAAGRETEEYFLPKELADKRIRLEPPKTEGELPPAEPPPPGEPPTPPPPEPPAPEPPAPPPGAPRPPLSLEVAERLIDERISVGERDVRRFSWRTFYRAMFDDLHPIKDITTKGYELARLSRGIFGKAEQFLERATFDFGTLRNNGRPLKDILAPVADDLNGLRRFLVSKRAIEIADSGREPGVNLEAARVIVEAGEAKYGQIGRDLVAYQNRVLEYLHKSGVLSDEAFGAMLEAGRNYVPFYRLIAGEERAVAGRGLGPQSPVKRLKGSDQYKTIDPLESIIKNTYAYLSVAERNAAGIEIIDALREQGFDVRTHARAPPDAELVQYLRENGITNPDRLAEFIHHAAPEHGDVLGAFRNGKRVTVEVNDPDLMAAFRALDRENIGLLVKVLSVPAQALRAGAVVTPEFMSRNIIRDFLTAMVTSAGRGIFHPIDTLEGLGAVVAKDHRYEAWAKSGGANATMVGMDRYNLQESLAKLNGETGLFDRGWNVIKTPFRWLQAMSETFENATRVAEYQKVLKDLGPVNRETMLKAGFASREVTLDFARMGAQMRSMNMITAFMNAQLQGVDRVGRAFKDRPVNSMLKVAGGITLPSVYLWWVNHDDPRYKELPQWQKDLTWVILTDDWQEVSASVAALRPDYLRRQRKDGAWEVNNGTIFRIPKPFELGVIFGSGAERILDTYFGDNPEALNGFSKSVIDAVLPNFTPTAVQPLVEQFANRSTFIDRTLVPSYVEKGLPEYEFTPYTTELTKKLGQMVAAFPGMREASISPDNPTAPLAHAITSPILMENYLRAWTGGLGLYMLQLSDFSLRKAGVLPDPDTPTPTLADIPVIKAFVVRYPSASAESIQKFYDDFERTERYYNTWKRLMDQGDAEGAMRVQAAGGDAALIRLNQNKQALTDFGKLVRNTWKDPNIKADEKRQLIDGFYYNMIQIAATGRATMKQMQEAMRATPQ